MALPTSGILRLSQVLTEFGDSPPKRMSAYYGLSGLPGSGLMRLSNFYGISSAPPVSYSWMGKIKMKPGRYVSNDGTTVYYGYFSDQTLDGSPRVPVGEMIERVNYTDPDPDWVQLAFIEGLNQTWDAFGITGLKVGVLQQTNYGTYDARDVDRVEYTITNDAGSIITSGLMTSVLNSTPDAKYGTPYQTHVSGAATGAISHLNTMVDVLKYCYNNNYTIEFRTIIP